MNAGRDADQKDLKIRVSSAFICGLIFLLLRTFMRTRHLSS